MVIRNTRVNHNNLYMGDDLMTGKHQGLRAFWAGLSLSNRDCKRPT